MSLPVPLTVRLSTGSKDAAVTRQLRDLWFRETAIGGFASARLALDRPLHFDPDEIRRYGRVYVHDGRNGQTVWEGRLADPGRGASAEGTMWQIAAEGPAAHASDRKVPLVYVDRDLTSLTRISNTLPGGRDSITEDPGGSNLPALVLQFPTGLTITTNDRVTMRYSRVVSAGQKLARVAYDWDAGVTDANEQTEALARSGIGVETVSSVSWNTAGGSVSGVVVTNWTDGRNILDLRINRSAAAVAVPNDTFWSSIRNLVIRAMLKDAIGGDITTGYTLNTVYAHEVVVDLLGRLLTSYDGANATIATATFPIERLAYPDGVTAEKLLGDLLLFEPAFRWGAYESNAAGKYRFEFVPWPTVVRYEADVNDGFDSPGSGDDLFDAVQVRWRDVNGEIRTNRRTGTVAELAAAGIIREDLIDLGEEVGTSVNADRAGDQFLAGHATAPNAGRLTLVRPVRDLVTGRLVMPWEIKAGELIRVRGVAPRVDVLNATNRDGVSVFRIWAKEYSASQAAATLDLDSYPVSVAHALAELRRRPVTRRR